MEATKGEMTISDIFSRSFEIYKANPVLIVPYLIPMLWVVFGSMILLAGFIGGEMLSGGFPEDFAATPDFPEGLTAAIFLVLGLFFIVTIVLFIVAQGATIEMIREAFAGDAANLTKAWESTKGKVGTLFIASLLSSIIMIIGYILLVIPGLILTFLLYFIAQAIMIDDMGAVDALKASSRFVRANLTDAVLVVLISMAIPFVLSIIPVIGGLLILVAMPFLISLATLLYMDRSKADLPSFGAEA
jgi:hypothetical protein